MKTIKFFERIVSKTLTNALFILDMASLLFKTTEASSKTIHEPAGKLYSVINFKKSVNLKTTLGNLSPFFNLKSAGTISSGKKKRGLPNLSLSSCQPQLIQLVDFPEPREPQKIAITSKSCR